MIYVGGAFFAIYLIMYGAIIGSVADGEAGIMIALSIVYLVIDYLPDLANIHKSVPAFHRGSRAWIHTNYPAQILSYVREADGRHFYVALNFSTHAVRFLPGGLDISDAGAPLLAARAERIGGEIEIGPYGFIVVPCRCQN